MTKASRYDWPLTLGAVALTAALISCSPTVKLEAPDKPIRFDVNVNVTQEIRIKIDEKLLEAFKANPELFGLGKLPNQSQSPEVVK